MEINMRKIIKRRIKYAAAAGAVALTAAVGGIIEKYDGDPFTIEPMATPAVSAAAEAPTAEPQVLKNKININTADKELLKTINGIGDALADKIITYREEHGPFGTIEDLMNVSGIGAKNFERLKESICVD